MVLKHSDGAQALLPILHNIVVCLFVFSALQPSKTHSDHIPKTHRHQRYPNRFIQIFKSNFYGLHLEKIAKTYIPPMLILTALIPSRFTLLPDPSVHPIVCAWIFNSCFWRNRETKVLQNSLKRISTHKENINQSWLTFSSSLCRYLNIAPEVLGCCFEITLSQLT